MTKHTAELRAQLRHVCWIGGGSCGGKSTTARTLADRYQLQLYATDSAMAEHGRRRSAEDCPLLQQFLEMSMDERWVNRAPEIMLETFHWFKGEGFGMIVDDLLGLPKEPGIIVEGFRLLPRLVQPLLENPRRAVWLLAKPEFRELVSVNHAGWGFLKKTGDFDKARQNLLLRDGLFTGHLRQEVQRLELGMIDVDQTTTKAQVAELVAKRFGLWRE